MQFLTHLLERYADFSQSAVWFAAFWFIQSGLLIAVGLIAARLLRGKGAAMQSAIFRTTLAAIMLCPAISLALQSMGIAGIGLKLYLPAESAPLPKAETIASSTQITPTIAPPPIRDDFAKSNSSAGEGFTIQPASAMQAKEDKLGEVEKPSKLSRFFSSMTWPKMIVSGLTAIWLIVSSVFMIRLLMSWRLAAYLRHTACPADDLITADCRILAKRIGVRAPTVLCSPFITSPLLIGLRRAAVVLPEELQSAGNCREILVHELAHLVRADGFWNFLGRLSTAILFFQPLLWLLNRRLAASAEEVCDDYVVHYCTDRPAYARRLVEIAEQYQPMPAIGVGVISLRSFVGRRIERILDSSRKISIHLGRRALVSVIAISLAVTFFIGLLTSSGNSTTAIAVEESVGTVMAADAINHSLSCLAFAPDSSTLAGGARDGLVIFWDAEKGEEKFVFTTNESNIKALAFLPNGEQLMTVGDSFKSWDVATRKCLKSVDLEKSKTRDNISAFSRDGKYAAGTAEKTLNVWTVETGRVKYMLPLMGMGLKAAFSPDGNFVAVGTLVPMDDQKNNKSGVQIWDMQTGQLKHTILEPSGSISGIAFSHDGKTIAGGTHRQVFLWDVETGKLKKTLSGANGVIETIAFSPDDQLLAAGCQGPDVRPADSELKVWNLRTNDLHWSNVGKGHRYWKATFSPNGKFIASCDSDSVLVENLENNKKWTKHYGLEYTDDTKSYSEKATDRPIAANSSTMGRVIDTNGRGVANAKLYSINYPTWTTTTDSEGHFSPPELAVGSGRLFEISAPGFITRERLSIMKLSTDTYAPKDLTFQIHRRAKISGCVLGLNGKPLARAPLSLELHTQYEHPSLSRNYQLESQTITDNDGAFTMDNVPPGTHLLYYPGGGAVPPIKEMAATQVVCIKNGQDITGLVLDLSKSTCSIEGQVFGPDGKPLGGGLVYNNYVYKVNLGDSIIERQSSTGWPHSVDAQGKFKIDRLQLGEWKLSTSHPRYQRIQKPELIKFSSDRQTVTQDLKLAVHYESDQNQASGFFDVKNHNRNYFIPTTYSLSQESVKSQASRGYYSFIQLSLSGTIGSVDTNGLNLPSDATPELIAKTAHVGELYFDAPDTLVTVNGTILAPCKIPKTKNYELDSFNWFLHTAKSVMVEQIEESRRLTPEYDGRRVKVKPGEWYYVVRDDRRAFLMNINALRDGLLHFDKYHIGQIELTAKEKLPATTSPDPKTPATPDPKIPIEEDKPMAVIQYEIEAGPTGLDETSSEKLLATVKRRMEAVESVKSIVKIDDKKKLSVVVQLDDSENMKTAVNGIKELLGMPGNVEKPKTLQTASDEVRKLLNVPGKLEFRILANPHDHKELIEAAKKDPDKMDLKDSQGKLLAWWAPLESDKDYVYFRNNPNNVCRQRTVDDKEVFEVLVVNDNYNMTGKYLQSAKVGMDSRGQLTILVAFNKDGAMLFGKLTSDNLPDESRNFRRQLGILIDGKLYSAPSINSRIYDRAEITGSKPEEVKRLAAILDSGELPVKLKEILIFDSPRRSQREK